MASCNWIKMIILPLFIILGINIGKTHGQSNFAQKYGISNPQVDFAGKTLEVNYTVSDFITNSMLEYSLWDINCKNGDLNASHLFNFTTLDLPDEQLDGTGTRQTSIYVEMLMEELSKSSLIFDYKIDGKSKATVEFCLRFGLLSYPTYEEVNFEEWVFQLFVELTDDGIVIDSFDTTDKESFDNELNQTYSSECYLCDSEGNELFQSDVRRMLQDRMLQSENVLRPASDFSMCVAPNEEAQRDGIGLDTVDQMEYIRTDWNTGYEVRQPAVISSATESGNGLSSLVCNGKGCRINSVLQLQMFEERICPGPGTKKGKKNDGTDLEFNFEADESLLCPEQRASAAEMKAAKEAEATESPVIEQTETPVETVSPTFEGEIWRCGCPDTSCNSAVWNSNPNGIKCGARIEWLTTTEGGSMTEIEACYQVAYEEYPEGCGGCNPETCWNGQRRRRTGGVVLDNSEDMLDHWIQESHKHRHLAGMSIAATGVATLKFGSSRRHLSHRRMLQEGGGVTASKFGTQLQILTIQEMEELEGAGWNETKKRKKVQGEEGVSSYWYWFLVAIVGMIMVTYTVTRDRKEELLATENCEAGEGDEEDALEKKAAMSDEGTIDPSFCLSEKTSTRSSSTMLTPPAPINIPAGGVDNNQVVGGNDSFSSLRSATHGVTSTQCWVNQASEESEQEVGTEHGQVHPIT